MTSIRMLIVEDDKRLLSELERLYREAFSVQGSSSVTVEQAETAGQAREIARQAQSNPYDLVSLDVNLGDAEATGLDVLSTLKRFRSAWMVVLLTGIETDANLDHTMGKAKAERIRRQLRRDAYSRFPAERLIVVEKPSTTLPAEEALKLLENRIRQIALIYQEIGRLRYIFRPIEVVSLERVKVPKGKKAKRKFIETESLHWQIRFNCGHLRTLPNRTGFRTLHHLLSMAAEDSLPAEQALAIEPKNEREEKFEAIGGDPVAAYFAAQGIQWEDLAPPEQEKLIKAALSLRFKRYVELRGYQEDGDISAEEEEQLARMAIELGPLADAAETAYQRMKPADSADVQELRPGEAAQNQLHVAGGNFEKTDERRKGYDSLNAQNFRKRMERTRDYLRENGFADFAKHLEDYLMSTGANWSYNPPEGIEWTT
jgi:CheY-like chemotaxis protein